MYPFSRDRHPRPRGFTLVELVVVIVVLAVLGGVAVVKYNDFGNRARSTTYIAHLRMMQSVILQYEYDHPDPDPDASIDMFVHPSGDTFSSSLLASRFHDNPMKAFGGMWQYHYEGSTTGYSFILGVGLPKIGGFPGAGLEYITKASGDTNPTIYVDDGSEEGHYAGTAVLNSKWWIYNVTGSGNFARTILKTV